MANTLKWLLLFILLVCGFEGCKNQKDETNVHNKTILTAEEQKQDLGSINKTKQRKAYFAFTIKNPSEKVVNIEATDVSCDCIHITESSHQVPAKKIAMIKGYVDTKMQKGHISKSIFVKHEKDNILVLRIVADIEE